MTSPLAFSQFFALTVSLSLTFLASPTPRVMAADPQEKKANVQKLKDAMDAAIQKSAVKQVAKAETEHLLVYATVPAGKIKPLADAAEKSFLFAANALKVEKVNELFAGKLILIVVPDRKPYANLVFAVEGKRPESGDTYEIHTTGDVPFVSVSLGLGEKPNDAELNALAAGWTASAVLNKKLGTDPGAFDLPEWVQLGYGKIAALRAEGNSAKLTAYRTKAKALANGRTRGAVKVTDLWSGSQGKDQDIFAMSVVDCLAFGSQPDRFIKLLTGLKKSDNNTNPTFESALAGLELKWEQLDAEWKSFVLKGK